MSLLRHMTVCLIFSITVLSGSNQTFAQDFTVDIPAFPGAEGFGAYTTGGRGGAVLEVTNLNDDGQGSLRAAIETTGARTIVFRVSGTIKLEANATDTDGNISIVEFFHNGDGGSVWIPIGNSTIPDHGSNYCFDWDTTEVVDGIGYVLRVVAFK